MHLLKWLEPGMHCKRWLLLFMAGGMLVSLGLALIFNHKYLEQVEESIYRFVYLIRGSYDYGATAFVGAVIILLGLSVMLLATRFVIRSVITLILPENSADLVDLVYEKRRLKSGPVITAIGGGHGLSMLLRGLKTMTDHVTAIVTVADDGGSSGRLREELGIIPPGDLRNCLVALADTEPLMERLFQYRFGGNKELAGHSFGNLFLAAMSGVTGDMESALETSSKVLAVKGRVLPASTQYVRLDATMEDGTVVCGESRIPLAKKRIKRVKLSPSPVMPVSAAIDAIYRAEVIVMGPGSLYTSVMPNLLVEGIAEAIKKSSAIKVYICNVMTQSGETDGYTASMHVRAIIEHAGQGIIDYVVVNSAPVSQEKEAHYAAHGEYPVVVDEEELKALGVGIVQADIVNRADGVHHDPKKLTECLKELLHRLEDSI